MHLRIDKSANYPVYRQIMDQITERIHNGELKVGDRIPTERELSISTNISRGTIKRAYDELSDEGILERIQGSGTYVSKTQDISLLGRKGNALVIINKMIDELTYMHLSYKEMDSIISNKLQWQRQMSGNIRIAVVDDNMETLGLISSQLNKIPGVDVSEFILIDLEKSPQRLTYSYDIILTTKNHYLQVIEMAPTVADRVTKVAIEPSQRVKYELACISNQMSVGIWCMSQEFANAAYEQISRMNHLNINVDYRLDSEPGLVSNFIKGKDVMVIPYDYFGGENAEDVALLRKFQEEGGKIIFFEYCIDQGSFMHITYQLEQCRQRKRTLNTREYVRQ